MIDLLLSLIGMGQSQSNRSADRFALASSHLANIEKICLKVGVQLGYEIRRLASEGVTKAQISLELGVSRMTVYRVLENENSEADFGTDCS
jgi:orotate phosphoribosyltransferase-like protein